MFAMNALAGFQPVNDWFLPDTTQRHPLGWNLTGFDPYWGQGEFIYVKSNDTIIKGSVCIWDKDHIAVLCPNTANQGFPLGVAMAPMTAGKYGWLQISGRCVYKTGSTVAADTAIGLTAAGVVGTLAAGKQILGCRNVVAATGTVTGTGTTTNTSSVLFFPGGYDGFFLGIALSGTGIPASTVAAQMMPDGKTIIMGSAVGTTGDKTATASGSVTVTGTYTGYGSGIISRPCAQGAIT